MTEEIVTYTLRDSTGMVRGRGIADEAMARATAARLIEDGIMPLKVQIERVTHVATTTREIIDTLGGDQ